MDSLQLFWLAADALERGEPIPQEARQWLLAGFKRHTTGEPLELALGLSSLARRKARDRALLDAAKEIEAAMGDLSAWELAERLEQAIKRFESRVLGKVKRSTCPDLPPIDAALLRAFQSGARPLTSARRLYDLLR